MLYTAAIYPATAGRQWSPGRFAISLGFFRAELVHQWFADDVAIASSWECGSEQKQRDQPAALIRRQHFPAFMMMVR